MGNVTSVKIIGKLQDIFAIHVLPQIIVTDNCTHFTSSEMSQYMKNNGISYLFSPPYHHASNGISERAVHTFKKDMGRTEGKGSIQEKIQRFLLNYRITPHTLTDKAPCELLMGRRIRSKLDLLLPTNKEVECKQEKKNRYNPGDAVFAKDFRNNHNWLEGRIEEIHNSIAWVRLPDGRNIRSHTNHLRTRGSQSIMRTVAQNVDYAPMVDVPPVRRSTREIRRPKRFDE